MHNNCNQGQRETNICYQANQCRTTSLVMQFKLMKLRAIYIIILHSKVNQQTEGNEVCCRVIALALKHVFEHLS